MNLKMITMAFPIIILFNCESQADGEGKQPVDISGTWIGIAYQMSDIPEEPNVSITFLFSQSGEEITGSFQSWGYTDTITDGSIINNSLSLKTRISEVDNVYYDFAGTVFQDSIAGEWRVVNLTTNEPWTTNGWYVTRESETE